MERRSLIFETVSEAHKLDKDQKPVPGNVGHDRIQQGKAAESIGEAIRYWYGLPAGQFERIDIEIDIIDDAFYLRPTICKYAETSRSITLAKVERPLTFTRDYISPFWRKQLEGVKKKESRLLEWSVREICRVSKDHRPDSKLPYIQEQDLLSSIGTFAPLRGSTGGIRWKGI